MVKRQKEKQYQSATEHRLNSRLRSNRSDTATTTRRLPFNCCALTLTPYTNPVCCIPSPGHGILFETTAIIPYLLKHKKDPITGNPMTTADLITVHMDADSDGQWQCPVLNKPFSDHSKIVAVVLQSGDKREANVYSYEAVDELNFKPKNFTDLTTGLKFHRTNDVIVLQDPMDDAHVALRDISNFQHIATLRNEGNSLAANSEGSGNVRHSVTASRIMEKIQQKRQQDAIEGKKRHLTDAVPMQHNKSHKVYTDELTGSTLSSGKCSSSFTSTVMSINSDNTAREATDEEILDATLMAMKKRKKKGFVRLVTNLGTLDLEMHCDIAPRTCYNFLGLVERKEYDGTMFHRSIKNFMIQGGKQQSSKGEETSFWGLTPFADEFDTRLTHTGPGVVSMANSGPGTNKRQFFITYKSAQHLNRKHSVFGNVIKGFDVLEEMANIPTDTKDQPVDDIEIIEAQILVNPIKEVEEEERIRIQERAEKKKREKEERLARALGRSNDPPPVVAPTLNALEKAGVVDGNGRADGVGKYLATNNLSDFDGDTGCKARKQTEAATVHGNGSIKVSACLPPPPHKTTFGDFSGW